MSSTCPVACSKGAVLEPPVANSVGCGCILSRCIEQETKNSDVMVHVARDGNTAIVFRSGTSPFTDEVTFIFSTK